jgi:hypothetical protein
MRGSKLTHTIRTPVAREPEHLCGHAKNSDAGVISECSREQGSRKKKRELLMSLIAMSRQATLGVVVAGAINSGVTAVSLLDSTHPTTSDVFHLFLSGDALRWTQIATYTLISVSGAFHVVSPVVEWACAAAALDE